MKSDSKPLPIVDVINLRKRYGLVQAIKELVFPLVKEKLLAFSVLMVQEKAQPLEFYQG